MLAATWITAVATGLLAILAAVTALYARRAFLKQSEEVRAIERQVQDQEELTRQQAELLKVQSGQLELQRHQLDDQRQANARQAEVLELQADERRRAQAARVTAWFAQPKRPGPHGALIRNASELPILDVRTFFYYIKEKWPGGDWEALLRGGPTGKIRVIPPQSDRLVAIPDQVREQIEGISDSIYTVSIEFTDAAGNRWERDPRGALIPRS